MKRVKVGYNKCEKIGAECTNIISTPEFQHHIDKADPGRSCIEIGCVRELVRRCSLTLFIKTKPK